MKQKIKKIIKTITPYKILKPIQEWHYKQAYLRIYFEKIQPILEKNKLLKNKFANKRCFVIGNGSSINQMDLLKLKNEYSFTVNRFFIHKQVINIEPSFYILIEPLIPLIKTRGANFVYDTFKQIETAYINPKTLFFFNLDAQNYISENNFLKNRNLYFLTHTTDYVSKNKILNKKNFDISKPMSFMNGAIFAALACAAYLGFKKIYLLGCDFDHILYKNEIHFYENKIKSTLEGASNLELAKNLIRYLSLMEQFNAIAIKNNIEIYNAGIKGFTDTFPRVDFDSLFT